MKPATRHLRALSLLTECSAWEWEAARSPHAMSAVIDSPLRSGPTGLPQPGGVKLEARHLVKRYGEREVLRDTQLAIEPGEFIAIVGRSGCGKSTLLRILAGLEHASRGTVELAGRRHAGPSRDIGVVFQAPVLLPWRNVLDNVLVPAQIQGRDPRVARERAMHYLQLVGLAGFETKYPGELSGGMQQRVGIARALVNDPLLLLMDEPFGALDAMTRESMNVELLKLRERTGATIMLVTHSIPEAVFLGDRVVVMSPRPGRVTQVIDVDLPATRTLDLINTERFGSHVSRIRTNLNATGGLD